MGIRSIINQNEAFILFFGMGKDKRELSSDENFNPHKFFIHPEHQATIREELKNLNITKARIYPELDKVAEYLVEEVYNK